MKWLVQVRYARVADEWRTVSQHASEALAVRGEARARARSALKQGEQHASQESKG